MTEFIDLGDGSVTTEKIGTTTLKNFVAHGLIFTSTGSYVNTEITKYGTVH